MPQVFEIKKIITFVKKEGDIILLDLLYFVLKYMKILNTHNCKKDT